MNKKLILIAIIALIAIVGAIYYTSGREHTESTSPTASSDTNTTTDDNSADPVTDKSQYVDYSPDVIATTTGTRILFFHAPWCPQCRALEESILSGSIPEGVTIIKVDYDSNQALRREYGVTIQTTLVRINDQGQLEERFVPYEEPTLQTLVDNLL
ncbi:MAG: thioredoxin family protein [Candidatus Saccharimonadales bacterium]